MKWKTIQWIAFFGLLCGAGACWLNYAFIHSINAGVVSGVIFGSNATIEIIATYGSIITFNRKVMNDETRRE